MASLGDVQQTFSSWDACMSKEYCKWPAIVGIIIGSLVVLSVVFCVARCLCFGAECCACCFSCLSCCCPSRKQKAPRGYENFNPPPPATPYQQYPQYSSPAAPAYTQSAPFRGPQTATFDAPSKSTARYNEDALPSMPTWDTASTRRVEEEPVEMDRLDNQHQGQHLLGEHAQSAQESPYGYARTGATSPYGQPQASPFGQPQQGATSPYAGARSPTSPYAASPYAPIPQNSNGYVAGSVPYPAQPRSPGYAHDGGSYQGISTSYASGHPAQTSPVYAQGHDQYDQRYDRQPSNINTNVAMPYHDYGDHQQYAPSMSPSSTRYAPSTTAPPSYHTREPSIVSPVQSSYNPVPARRPVQGTWRDV